jgi:hypothetical protein
MTTNPEFDPKEKRLRALLSEDFGDEAQRFLPVVRELNRLPELSVSREEVAQVTGKLREYMPKPQPEIVTRQRRWQAWFPLTLLRAELQLMRYEVWLASALVMLIGILVAANDPMQAGTPFVHIAPIMAALGVAFIFNLNPEPPSEIVLSCMISIRMILLARLTLIYCLNLLLGVVGSVFLVVINANLSLWPLVAAWLAPMTFLSALAFFVAIVAKDPLLGAATSLVLWIWQHVDIPYLRLPISIMSIDRLVLLVAAAVLCGVAMWLAGKDERWIGATS